MKGKVNGDARPTALSYPGQALVALAGFLSILFVPAVFGISSLRWTFLGIGIGLISWSLALWVTRRRRGAVFESEFVSISSHWVQACVQASILAYWAWFVPAVVAQVPLIVAQIFFMYALDALISWTRGRTWRIGFGPLPIVLSTNLLLWFKPEWFAFQFVMLTLGALGKNFITWERNGKRAHIFNPSAFGQFLIAIVLILTGLTKDLTFGKEIAASFEPPHMLIVIFLGGLVVQCLFGVTLITFSAAGTLCLFSLAYHWIYGTYYFVNTNIAATIFLGIHLLLTDPATSPRTNVGKIAFGAMYALGYAVLFRVLDTYEVPTFWDKLLPVPILNLLVPWIDHVARSGLIGRVNLAWESFARPRLANMAHMACWIGLFSLWFATGYIEGPHEGSSITFWKRAVLEGKPHAGNSLVMAAGSLAEGRGSAAAYNELGLICFEGVLVKPNHARAAEFFDRASDLGDPHGTMNVVSQFLFYNERLSDLAVDQAFVRLESLCEAGFDGPACWLLARAHEIGRGRTLDRKRALELYMRCDATNPYAAKGIARIALVMPVSRQVLTHVVRVLEAGRSAGDAESCWYLAFMSLSGVGGARDEARARALLEEACSLGATKPCQALLSPTLPAFTMPDAISVPPLATAFPLP
ncbi:MAG: SEL1-like repeat protein [Planctomycetes bacterium]|nr:SEL1-like repeat protein [Planctomycetota bacterium]